MRKQKFCKSPEAACSCQPCLGSPKVWRPFKQTNAKFLKFPLIFYYVFIIFLVTFVLKWASVWALHFAVLISYLVSPNFCPAPSSLNRHNCSLYLLSSLVLPIAEHKSFTWILTHPIKSDFNIVQKFPFLGRLPKNTPAALTQPENMNTSTSVGLRTTDLFLFIFLQNKEPFTHVGENS